MLLNGVLRSVLGGRRRRSPRALRYLTGARGGIWSKPSLLLTAAGLAWGVYETLQRPSAPVPYPPSGSDPGLLPPLPATAGAAPAESAGVLRIIRLAISAAAADGSISEEERAAILAHARQAGVEALLERELSQPRALADIVRGVSDQAERGALYLLAYGITRGDEQPSGAERIYLAKLAHLLNLDADTIRRLEGTAGERIDREPVEGG